MTVEQIAKKHGVSVELIESELKMGISVEKEHVDSVSERRQYALDHLEEIPDYYTRLSKMEDEAKESKSHEKSESKKDERKESEGLHDDEADKAFDKWTSLGDKMDMKPTSKSEYFPSISLSLPGSSKMKVGEEMEVEFKVCVESIEKTKDGTRVRLELKEAKFDKE